jgi:hypothetical protein
VNADSVARGIRVRGRPSGSVDRGGGEVGRAIARPRGCFAAQGGDRGRSAERRPVAGVDAEDPYRANVTTGVSERYGAVRFPRKS